MKYLVEVYRDGPWWMVAVPAIDGLTQARDRTEVELMARELIALETNVEPNDVSIEVHTRR